jgi:hypothetical protein
MAPRPDRIPLRPDPSALRSRAVNNFVRLVTAYLLRATSGGQALDDILWRYWSTEEGREIQTLSRAATLPGSTASGGWAATLAQTTSREFLMSLGPVSAGSTLLRRCLTFEFGENADAGIKVPAIVTAATGSGGFTKQGDPIAVKQFALTSVTLTPCALATISTFTRETMLLSMPSLETMVNAVLTQSAGLKMDAVMFSNASAVPDVSPAGLLQGLSGLTPSTATPLSEALVDDVGDLAAAVAPVALNAPIIFIAAPKQAVSLKLFFRGNPPTYEVLTSSALAAGTVIAVATNAVASAIAPNLGIDVSSEATLHMEDTSPAQLATGTGPTVATPIRSLYQTDTLAARIRFDVGWALRHTSGLAFMNSVTW